MNTQHGTEDPVARPTLVACFAADTRAPMTDEPFYAPNLRPPLWSSKLPALGADWQLRREHQHRGARSAGRWRSSRVEQLESPFRLRVRRVLDLQPGRRPAIQVIPPV